MGRGLSLTFVPFVLCIINFIFFYFTFAHDPQGRVSVACLTCSLMIPKFMSLIESTRGLSFQPWIRVSAISQQYRVYFKILTAPTEASSFPPWPGKMNCVCEMLDQQTRIVWEKQKKWVYGRIYKKPQNILRFLLPLSQFGILLLHSCGGGAQAGRRLWDM